jgi:FkbM family methyltransferase
MSNRLVPTVKRTLARRPALYLRARRAFDIARWAARRPHERDFEFYRYAPPAAPGRVFLDVGANTGVSALSFRVYDKRTPIVSIEPDATLEHDLELVGRLIGGFEYHRVAAGSERGELTLHTPCYRGTPLSGETSAERREASDVWWYEQNVDDPEPQDFSVIEQRAEVIPLDDLELAPAHVKIDVEGMELDVLRGLRRTLAEHRPTILVERSEDFSEICSWLSDAGGYRPMKWARERHELVPLSVSDSPQNVFFVAGVGTGYSTQDR